MGHSPGRSEPDEAAALMVAMGKITIAIAKVDDEQTIADLVAERRAMRDELAALRRERAANVVDLDSRRRR